MNARCAAKFGRHPIFIFDKLALRLEAREHRDIVARSRFWAQPARNEEDRRRNRRSKEKELMILRPRLVALFIVFAYLLGAGPVSAAPQKMKVSIAATQPLY